MKFPRKCSVENGCGKFLCKSAFFVHKAKGSCKKDISSTGTSESQQLDEEIENNVTMQRDNSTIYRWFLQGLLLWQMLNGISDRAIQTLVAFLRKLFLVLANMLKNEPLKEMFENVPYSLYNIRNYLQIDRGNFDKYIVCAKCHTIYFINGKEKFPKECITVLWPNHPVVSKRQPCHGQLLNGVSGRPKRIYSCGSIKSYLQLFTNSPDFVELCNEWKKRATLNDTLVDIYDGNIWKQFEEEGYFNSNYNLMIMLNVDWLQPYKHSPYSLGAIYGVILNLPRRIRFKDQYVMLLGVIPGPKEPPRDVNSYLQPIVDELLKFEQGVLIHDSSAYGNIYRVRLLGTSSDVPATRKLGGFVGHGAKKGCSKCLKSFPRIAGESSQPGLKADYSGFEKKEWPLRDNVVHRLNAEQAKQATCPTSRVAIEKEHGARWSVLYRLPYYKPVQYHSIDPMHCMYLGVTKRFTKLLFDKNYLTKSEAQNIQNKINKIKVPSNIGRIPRKIGSQFSGLTADQWKNWLHIYSSITLKNKLPENIFNLWMLLVRAMNILSRRTVKTSDLDIAEQLILKFATSYENTFGASECTPNLHLLCHMVDVIRDFGPVYAFWCYSFERYNGTIGSFTVNSHEITTQIMRHFIQNSTLMSMEWPISTTVGMTLHTLRGTLQSQQTSPILEVLVKNAFTEDLSMCAGDITEYVVLPDKQKTLFFEAHELSTLNQVFERWLYQEKEFDIIRQYASVSEIEYMGEIFQDETCRGNNVIQARWLDENGDNVSPVTKLQRTGVIQKILVVKVNENNPMLVRSHHILKIKWYAVHPTQTYRYGINSQTYYNHFLPDNFSSYMPLQRVICKCASYSYKLNHQRLVTFIPIPGVWALV